VYVTVQSAVILNGPNSNGPHTGQSTVRFSAVRPASRPFIYSSIHFRCFSHHHAVAGYEHKRVA
jgi:hypothetical protein